MKSTLEDIQSKLTLTNKAIIIALKKYHVYKECPICKGSGEKKLAETAIVPCPFCTINVEQGKVVIGFKYIWEPVYNDSYSIVKIEIDEDEDEKSIIVIQVSASNSPSVPLTDVFHCDFSYKKESQAFKEARKECDKRNKKEKRKSTIEPIQRIHSDYWHKDDQIAEIFR